MYKFVSRTRILVDILEFLKELQIAGSFVCFSLLTNGQTIVLGIVGMIFITLSYIDILFVFTVNKKISKFLEFLRNEQTASICDIKKELTIDDERVKIKREVLLIFSLACFILMFDSIKDGNEFSIKIAKIGVSLNASSIANSCISKCILISLYYEMFAYIDKVETRRNVEVDAIFVEPIEEAVIVGT